ncbi:exo-beta-N-acetylmuramidase NamZ family protein [Nubsella zeaxanthinifaciens]|uniref:exo-beta-N-acetylmuramidase NamZ family protein n=1 Tax=Nubsella zeaxanthinifaciens TaxID=392412 RepID=UPI000DE2546A|nr:DUF1343 domain-containing protein [Nubsella zeaxanthinifaciens]
MVQFGIDVLLESATFKNLRIGLVCNEASVTNTGLHSRLALLNAGFSVVKLFAPEHGFNTKGDDGAFIHDCIDSATQLPIVSLYGEKLAPNESDLATIDLVIIDLPDIGSRFYTYLWTMTYVMEACANYGKNVLILDRPNPIASEFEFAEGPILEPANSSFIGRFTIPIKHNCTLAELANYFNHKYYPLLNLQIVAMKNWDRYANDNYIFTGTSPAIQKRRTTYIYPGTCLFEGLNVNEGRGTAFPFEQFGAPWINAQLLKEKLLSKDNEIDLEIVSFTAAVQPYQNELCHGLKIKPRHLNQFKPVNFALGIIKILAEIHPNELKERNYLTNVNPNGEKHLDKLLGISDALIKIKTNEITTSIPAWKDLMQPFLLYH